MKIKLGAACNVAIPTKSHYATTDLQLQLRDTAKRGVKLATCLVCAGSCWCPLKGKIATLFLSVRNAHRYSVGLQTHHTYVHTPGFWLIGARWTGHTTGDT